MCEKVCESDMAREEDLTTGLMIFEGSTQCAQILNSKAKTDGYSIENITKTSYLNSPNGTHI